MCLSRFKECKLAHRSRQQSGDGHPCAGTFGRQRCADTPRAPANVQEVAVKSFVWLRLHLSPRQRRVFSTRFEQRDSLARRHGHLSDTSMVNCMHISRIDPAAFPERAVQRPPCSPVPICRLSHSRALSRPQGATPSAVLRAHDAVWCGLRQAWWSSSASELKTRNATCSGQ